jgi:glucosamine--fructose-6-phosphate aminotransferase (isomerizing)
MTGALMTQEMAEQPERLRALIGRADEIGDLVRGVLPSPLNGVSIVARGSSDHAAVYGRYLLEFASGRPVSLAAPSLHTLYEVKVDYSGQLVVGVSQSGQTPEIVRTLSSLSGSGGRALAITNDPASDLAAAASAVIDLGVGEERAVPATKTVTAQFVAFAVLAHCLGEVPFSLAELERVPDWVSAALDDSWSPASAAETLVSASHLIVVARGFMFGAALETALKIKETCSLLADGYSAADLRHGPIAAVTRGFPVIAMTVPGPGFEDMAEVVGELRYRGASVLTVASESWADVPLPGGMPEALAPIVAVVRGQQLAYELAVRLGFDPDQPEGLSKVTVT